MRVYCVRGVQFELCSNDTIELLEFVVSMDKARADIELYKSMNYEGSASFYDDLYKVLDSNLEKASYDERFRAFYNECYHDYMTLSAIENDKYREYAEADFLEYASHKNEPNFDWDFYSDWHKDLYGFRPRH